MAARIRVVALAVPLGCVALASAAVAYVCHPEQAGTRTLTLRGTVRSAVLRGGGVEFVVSRAGRCTRILWSTQTGRAARAPTACSATVIRRVASARGGGFAVRIAARGRPVLEQRATQLRLPLPTRVRPRTLSLSDGVAVVAAAGDPGVFAIRISDGAFALLGPNGGAFRPLLDARGVVFHDGESKRALREGQTIVKFVPRAGIEALLAQASAPVRTGGPIRALSFDGPRVALAVGDRRQLCDRVLYWNVAWPPVQQITARPGVTCLPGVRGIRISSLAIGGFHTAWLATSRATSRLVAGSPHCQEWVVRRFDPRPGGEQLIALAGDHATIAYAATTHEQGLRGMTSVGVVTGRWRPRQITSGLGTPRALAVSDHRVAVVWPDGRLELRTDGGRLLGQFGVGAARAVALEGSTLAVLRRGRLDLYDVRAAQRTRSLHVPISATSVDLQYGVAALAAGRSALVVDVPSGRLAVVGTAPERLVGVEIESYGLAYAWNSGHGGIAQLVPWTGIDATLA